MFSLVRPVHFHASMPVDLSQEIRDRTFRFACAVSSIVVGCVIDYKLRSLVDQLLRSATSVGANLEEAKAASSRREFLRYILVTPCLHFAF